MLEALDETEEMFETELEEKEKHEEKVKNLETKIMDMEDQLNKVRICERENVSKCVI